MDSSFIHRSIAFLFVLTFACLANVTGQDAQGSLQTWTKAGVSMPGDADGKLREVRAAKNRGFDRVVFEFADDVPQFSVQYVKPPIDDGTDTPVTIAGGAFLEVKFHNYHGEDRSADALY
ncbi:MAG TPA: hypothetical protein VJL58_07505, partial [Pyrinomonadaceae bacterium]|nr:hypothetical protein [Pyrinomonadaceae bacterium]